MYPWPRRMTDKIEPTVMFFSRPSAKAGRELQTELNTRDDEDEDP